MGRKRKTIRQRRHERSQLLTAIGIVVAVVLLYSFFASNSGTSQAGLLTNDPSTTEVTAVTPDLLDECEAVWAECQRLLDVLGNLLEEQQDLMNQLREATSEEIKAGLRLQLWILSIRIDEAAGAVNHYASRHSDCFPRLTIPEAPRPL